MKNCIKFFEFIDPFGVTINFNYKGKQMYKSSFGGFIFLIFALASFVYIAINFAFFYNRTTKTVYSYNKELPQTGNFSFQNYSAGLSLSFTCDKYDNEYGKLTDIFSVKASLIRFTREDGKRIKNKTVITTHKCTNADFYNELNDSVISHGLGEEGFYCPDNNNYIVGGIISDKNYSYYEVYVESIYDEMADNYTELLYEYDCKLSVYFTDGLIDVSNIDNPVSKYINYKFIQLSPVEFKKYNLYFNIKRFLSDENWFLTSPKETVFLGYSRADEYVTGMGNERYVKQYEDYKKYAKFFIRIDTNEFITNRRYEKFTEFFSTTTSLVSSIYLALKIILKYINRLYCIGSIFESSFLTGKEGIERRKRFELSFRQKIKDLSVINYINTIKSTNFELNTDVNVKNFDKIFGKVFEKSLNSLNAIKNIKNMNKKNLSKIQKSNVDLYEKINNASQSYEASLNKKLSCRFNNYLEDEDEKNDNKNGIVKEKIIDDQKSDYDSSTKQRKSILTYNLNKNNETRNIKDTSALNNFSNNNILRPEDKIKIQIQGEEIFAKNNFNIFNYQVDARKIAYYLGLYKYLCCIKKTNHTDEERRVIKETLENFLELLDITNFLKKNKDIELMKYLLINKNEDILMELLEKPSIYVKKNSLFQIMTALKKGSKEKKKTEEFWKRFSELIYKKDKNEFERKLCYLVCSEINDLMVIKK